MVVSYRCTDKVELFAQTDCSNQVVRFDGNNSGGLKNPICYGSFS